MPIYAQRCRGCGHDFEIIMLSMSDGARVCPRCHSSDTEQLPALFACQFKGRGFEIKRGPAHNPYDGLVLEHVRDERGQPVRVNSERELHEAEKKYNFVHAASWGMEKEPPKHESWAGDVHHNYERKFNLDPAAYQGNSAIESADAGPGVKAQENSPLKVVAEAG